MRAPVYVSIDGAGSLCGLVGRNADGVLVRVAQTHGALTCVFTARAFHGTATVYSRGGLNTKVCDALSRSDWREIRRLTLS